MQLVSEFSTNPVSFSLLQFELAKESFEKNFCREEEFVVKQLGITWLGWLDIKAQKAE